MRAEGSTPPSRGGGGTGGAGVGKDGSGAAGSRAALTCLRAFEREFDYVYRSLLRHGVGPADAEDLAQDVFLVIWRRWADFDAGRPLRPWLAGIAFKVASDHLKRRRRWEPRAFIDPPDQAPGGEELLAASRARALALRGLAALPEQQRALIVLHDLEGVTMREVARLFGVPLFTAYSRLRAARRAFTDEIGRQLGGRSAAGAAPAAARSVLVLERTPPAAPPETRRRSLARLRGWLLLPAGVSRTSTPTPEPTPAPAPARLLPAALGLALPAALALIIALLARPDAPAPAVTASRTVATPLRRPIARVPAIRSALPSETAAPPAPAPVVRAGAPGPGGSPSGGLVGHWRYDSTSAVPLFDLSGNANHCSVQRPAGAPPPEPRPPTGTTDRGPQSGLPDWGGEGARALELDGRTFLSCARPEPLAQLRTELTVSLWMRPVPGAPERQVLIARQMGSSPQQYFAIALHDGWIELFSHAWQSATRRPLPPAARPWRHVAAIHKDDGRTALYVDGVLIGRSNRSRRVHLGGGSSRLTFGASVEGPDPGDARALFAGAIDEVRIYNRALRGSELKALAADRPPAARPSHDSGDKLALSFQ
jgi:RNA polymerase sigma factor (sigma-70 family)